MKRKIEVSDYAQHIYEALTPGILLNTQNEKFNSMVIGWGHLGRVFRLPSFTVFVRENRYTRRQIDQTKEFTISIPLGKPDPMINEICGMKSGHDLDKVAAASLTLEEPDQINTPGIRVPTDTGVQVLHSSP